ncbi:hypothetical protein EJD98_30440, partial [Mycolicibacterium peregrinum]
QVLGQPTIAVNANFFDVRGQPRSGSPGRRAAWRSERQGSSGQQGTAAQEERQGRHRRRGCIGARRRCERGSGAAGERADRAVRVPPPHSATGRRLAAQLGGAARPGTPGARASVHAGTLGVKPQGLSCCSMASAVMCRPSA